jgi:hypothetical protein
MFSATLSVSMSFNADKLAHNDDLKRIQDGIDNGDPKYDEAKANMALAGGQVQAAVSAGLALRGSLDGRIWRFGFIAGDLKIKWIPLCWNDNHEMCGPDYACWAFICLPKMDNGLPCTHDVHCKSSHCADEKGALWCVECSQDEHCPSNQFCEAGLTGVGAFFGGNEHNMYECRDKVRRSSCSCFSKCPQPVRHAWPTSWLMSTVCISLSDNWVHAPS